MAEKFIQHTGLVVPLDAANVDTDAIIPKQFLQKVTRTGFGAHLFNDWRFLDDKGQQPNPDFVLNFPVYKGASILLARENFGCGSSREHAPIAIRASGVSCVIAESFARIFYRNSINIGFPILECAEASHRIQDGDTVTVDFETGEITDMTTGEVFHATPFPAFIQNIVENGGLLPYLKNKLEAAK